MMEVLYLKEHLTCYNYTKGNAPTIEQAFIPKGYTWKPSTSQAMVIFEIEGSIKFSFDQFTYKILQEKKMALIPSNTQFEALALEDSTVIAMRLKNVKQLCDCFPLDMLLLEKEDSDEFHFEFLEINKKVESFLSFTGECVQDGLKCTYYLDLKVKEFLFLLRAYYEKKDLFHFFYPILTGDVTFSSFVMDNHHRVKTVQELADLAHYSLSGFQKRFKKVFGVSAYNWMNTQRSKSIYHEINSTEKSLKEISDEFGFSSPSHFNDFCKSHFGDTPGKIRSKKSTSKI